MCVTVSKRNEKKNWGEMVFCLLYKYAKLIKL